MKIVLEKIRTHDGHLRDIVVLPNPETIYPADSNPSGIAWVQVVKGTPVQAFSARDLIVIEVQS